MYQGFSSLKMSFLKDVTELRISNGNKFSSFGVTLERGYMTTRAIGNVEPVYATD